MNTNLSIIIPTLNEESYLPGLLEAIGRQTWPPLEIIIADAGSTDHTVEIAQKAGYRVVPGGSPARGRNAGVTVARGDIFLFLDADVLPEPAFLSRALDEFNRRRLDVATCPVQALGGNLTDTAMHKAANIFIQAVQPFSPHAPGFCIFARRQTHESVCGFDETLYMSEDHDYVRRITAQGRRFGVLHVPIPVSVRRLDTDGRWNVALRYTFLTINQLIGDRFNQAMFDRYLGEYRFGYHQHPSGFHHRTQINKGFHRIGQTALTSIRQSATTVQKQTCAFVRKFQPGLAEDVRKRPSVHPNQFTETSNIYKDQNAG